MKSLLKKVFMKYPIPKPVLVVCATQRSGTTVLEETLAQGPTFEKYGEVFIGPDQVKVEKQRRFNYFNFRSEVFRTKPELSIPTKENQRSLFHSYLKMLCEKTDKKAIIIDIKYNSWHHLNDIWYPVGQPPYLVELVQKWKLPVLHLVRRNSFQRSCSLLVAQHTKRWHIRRHADKPERVSIKVDPKRLGRMIRDADGQVSMFQRFFQDYGRYHEIYYENLFENDQLKADIGDQVSSLCRFPVQFDPTLTQRKAVPRLRDFISNFEELQQHFAGTEIESQLKAA